MAMVAAAASAPHRNFAMPDSVGKAVKKHFGKHSGTRVLVKNASNDISFESIVQYKSYDSSECGWPAGWAGRIESGTRLNEFHG
jgi:hypothetical protein